MAVELVERHAAKFTGYRNRVTRWGVLYGLSARVEENQGRTCDEPYREADGNNSDGVTCDVMTYASPQSCLNQSPIASNEAPTAQYPAAVAFAESP